MKYFSLILVIGIILNLHCFAQNNAYYDIHTNTYQLNNSRANFYNTNPLPPFFNWQMTQTPIEYFIRDVFFVDSLYGWASHTNGGIFKTTNNGINWSHTYINPGGSINGISFINRDTGWICGTQGKIRKTTNGGIIWLIQDYMQINEYYSAFFFNNDTGYITGGVGASNGTVIRTINGGQNWEQIYLSSTTQTALWGQCWINNSECFFYGSNSLLKTTDGGLSFIDYYQNLPPTSNGYNALLGMSFANAMTGWISGSNLDNKNLYKTSNAGLKWTFQNNPVAQYQFVQLDDIIFLNENTGWAGAYVGQIIATTNGGTNWFTDLQAPTWFYCFTKYNNNKVWCGARFGQVWYLNDLTPIGIIQIGNKIPEKYVLKQNYPNPFNGQTIIEFDVPNDDNIKIILFDITGKEIETIANGNYKSGTYKININLSNLATGVYFYTIDAGNYYNSKKMVLIK